MDEILSDWRISMLAIGLGLIILFLEVFVPSGGILGLISLGLSGFGIYGLFQGGHPLLAVGAIVGVAGLTILGLRFSFKRLGFKAVLLQAPPSPETLVAQSLVGKSGVAQTTLRPAGVAVIEGHRVDVVSKGQYIEAGTAVRVSEYAENRLVVVPAN